MQDTAPGRPSTIFSSFVNSAPPRKVTIDAGQILFRGSTFDSENFLDEFAENRFFSRSIETATAYGRNAARGNGSYIVRAQVVKPFEVYMIDFPFLYVFAAHAVSAEEVRRAAENYPGNDIHRYVSPYNDSWKNRSNARISLIPPEFSPISWQKNDLVDAISSVLGNTQVYGYESIPADEVLIDHLMIANLNVEIVGT